MNDALPTDTEDETCMSLCIDCARHPALKASIRAKTVEGVCAFCCRPDAPVRDPADARPFIMLLRALIRFYWDEAQYNSHWGGDALLDLFKDPENPLIEPAVDDRYHDEFDHFLQEDPYPPWDDGISLYAGFSDGIRMLEFAISRTVPQPLRELRNLLIREGSEAATPVMIELLSPFLADIEISLPAGTLSFRARTGVAAVYQRTEGFDATILRKPLTGTDIGPPPAALAGVGRLNRAEKPVLYIASKPYTALAEIRPHPGHYVSIGGFETKAPSRLADFDPDIANFATSDARLSQFAVIQALDRLMSAPVTPDDKSGYLLTQLLAEVLAERGFDGVRYRSSVSDGINICLFDPGAATFVASHSEVRSVKSVTYDAPPSPCLMKPGPRDREIRV